MGTKYVALNDRLYEYLLNCRSDAADPLLAELRAETAALGEVSICQISDEQGAFLSILVAALGVRTALEVGTFTGYSSLCMARALPANGRLICVDQSKEWTDIARKHWKKAGLSDRIDLRLGAAIPILEQLEPNLSLDFVFIDAEKTQYEAYYELLLPHVKSNGLILFDNMLSAGRVGNGALQDPIVRAIDALNHKLANDKRIEAVLLPVADGIQFCRKL